MFIKKVYGYNPGLGDLPPDRRSGFNPGLGTLRDRKPFGYNPGLGTLRDRKPFGYNPGLGELSYGRTSQSEPRVITRNFAMTFPEYRAAIVTTPPDAQGNIVFSTPNPQYNPLWLKGTFDTWDEYYAHHDPVIWYSAPPSFSPPSSSAAPTQSISTPIAPAVVASAQPMQNFTNKLVDYQTALTMPEFNPDFCLGHGGETINFVNQGGTYRTTCPLSSRTAAPQAVTQDDPSRMNAAMVSTPIAPPILIQSTSGGGPASAPIQDSFAPSSTTVNAGMGSNWWLLGAGAVLFLVFGKNSSGGNKKPHTK